MFAGKAGDGREQERGTESEVYRWSERGRQRERERERERGAHRGVIYDCNMFTVQATDS
jgi:hypothetical protein